MRRLMETIGTLFKAKLAFRLALLYLSVLVLLVVALPWLPLPFLPNELDLSKVFAPPFHWEHYAANRPFHWLGTDALGRDVLVNIVYGARTALMISLPVMLLATGLGLFMGSSAGLFGNHKLRISNARLLLLLPSLVAMAYYTLYVPFQLALLKADMSAYILPTILAFAIPGVLLFIGAPMLMRWDSLKKTTPFPFDHIVLRLIETLTSIPKLIFILVLAAFAPPSLLLLSALLVLTFWTGPARLARGEMLRIKELPYFEAAISSGVTQWQLIWRHAMPNLLAPVAVSFVFGLAALLMIESTLSFLNIGVSTELVSWGRMISGIRANTAAWWLVAFPGAFLSLTVLALQTCSYYLLQASQEKR
ncbi:ABC transporter permease [Pontibacter sp. JH31]|uniref:ABC transporter permease n=1 Tax=Pontibacter aquaedesilientis TaxID=2766980 RepID=A0ABR7XC62_9BACT|nr:ABC transporter permease [Pontibacter aquaedesilientis]MBD1395884.1 ABC transporter permease [Pontibacter aquaedesilientis]